MDEQPHSIKAKIIEDPRESAQKRRQEEEKRLEQQHQDRLQARLAKLRAIAGTDADLDREKRELATKDLQAEEKRFWQQRQEGLQAHLAVLRAIGKAPAQRQTRNERQQEIQERFPQDRLKAQQFQREVQAAAVAAQKAGEAPSQGHPKSVAPHRGRPANMSRDASLDSLIVKILGKIWEPNVPIQEVQDLVVALPAAVNSERAAHESKIAELENKTSGGGGTKKSIDLDAQKEIQNLKSINSSLRSDVQRLEQSKKEAAATYQQALNTLKTGPNLQKEITKLNNMNSCLKADIKKLELTIKPGVTSTQNQTASLEAFEKLKDINGGMAHDIKKLEQAVKDGNAKGYCARTSYHGESNYGSATTNQISTTTAGLYGPQPPTRLENNRTVGNQEATSKNDTYQKPVVNLQSRLQSGSSAPAVPRIQPCSQPSTAFVSQPSNTIKPKTAAANPMTGPNKLELPPWNTGTFPALSFQQNTFLPTGAKPQVPSWNPRHLPTSSLQYSPFFATGSAAAADIATNASLPVNGNPQSQLQALQRPPPQDPRTQLYSASPAGMFFQSSGPADATNSLRPVQGNGKAIIHPSRLGQVDEAVLSTADDPRLSDGDSTMDNTASAVIPPTEIAQKSVVQAAHGLPSDNPSGQLHPIVMNEDWGRRYVALSENMTAQATEKPSFKAGPDVQEARVDATQDPRLIGRSTTTTGNKDAVSPSFDATEQSQDQTAELSTTSNSGMPSHVPSSTRSLLTIGTWKPMFNGSYRNAPSLGVTVSSPISEGSPLSSHSELNSANAMFGKKRAASLPNEQESAKKTKLNSTDGVLVDKSLTSLGDDIGQLQAKHVQAKYVQAKQRMAAPPSIGGMDVDKSNPKTTVAPVPTAAVVQSKEHERRDSAVATAAFFDPPPATLDGRQPTCMHCRFAKLECNHKSPCQNCEASMNACVYWKCEHEEKCTAPNCWYSHEPASEDIEELLPGKATESHA